MLHGSKPGKEVNDGGDYGVILRTGRESEIHCSKPMGYQMLTSSHSPNRAHHFSTCDINQKLILRELLNMQLGHKVHEALLGKGC